MEPAKKKVKLEELEDLQESPGKSIVDLNDDCLEEIFSYFSLQELVEVDKVCPRFRNVAEEYFYRKQKVLKISGVLQNGTQIAEMAERMGPYVSTLEISDLFDQFTDVETVKPLYMKCINLEHLFMEKTNVRTHFSHLKKIFKNLKTAKLINCRLTARIGVCLKNAHKLESLSLHGNFKIAIEFLPGLKCQLKELDLRGWKRIFEGRYFAEFCRDNRELECLTFHFIENTPVSVMSHLNELKNLRKLHIEFPQHAPATTISPHLPRLRHLVVHDIAGHYTRAINNLNNLFDSIKDSVEYLTFAGLYTEEFLLVLGKFTKLKFLKIERNLCKDSHLAGINSNCRRTLEELLLDSEYVTDTGLLQLLKDCFNLKRLNLRNCSKISNDLITGLLPFLKERSQSMEIWVRGTSITRAIEEELQLRGNQKIKLNWEEYNFFSVR